MPESADIFQSEYYIETKHCTLATVNCTVSRNISMQTVEMSRCITSDTPLLRGYFLGTPKPSHSIRALPEVAISCITLGYFPPVTLRKCSHAKCRCAQINLLLDSSNHYRICSSCRSCNSDDRCATVCRSWDCSLAMFVTPVVVCALVSALSPCWLVTLVSTATTSACSTVQSTTCSSSANSGNWLLNCGMVLHNTKHMLAWQKVAVPVDRPTFNTECMFSCLHDVSTCYGQRTKLSNLCQKHGGSYGHWKHRSRGQITVIFMVLETLVLYDQVKQLITRLFADAYISTPVLPSGLNIQWWQTSWQLYAIGAVCTVKLTQKSYAVIACKYFPQIIKTD